MKYRILLIMLFLPFFGVAQQQILQRKITEQSYSDMFSDLRAWQNSRAERWREQLRELPEELKEKIIRDADTANVFTWPSLLASKYLEYKNSGNRTNYESEINLRRAKLSQLVAGEMLRQDGTYIPQIANGLWLILEESTWVSPAHIVVQQAGTGLVDPYDSYIDLGAGRVAADLAVIYQALPHALDTYSPQLRRKIKYELDKRILEPYLLRKDFWWMGYGKGFINNWNIWINNNVLRTALLVMDDSEKQKQIILKVMESSDKFIDYYPEDGACEEGPSYWMHAGGELGTMLQLLKEASFGKFDVSQEAKIHRMGQYILRMHIDGNRFVNFADALAIEYPAPSKVATYGDIFKDQDLNNFAAYLWNRHPSANSGNVQDLLLLAATYKDITKATPRVHHALEIVYPSLQLVKWQSESTGKGLTFVGIGGHNGVSHNHNDVGSFMLFADNIPVLIDVGVGTYNSKTFSSKRYEIWNMQSQWHSLPTINGVMQRDGAKFRATAVKLPSREWNHSFSLDIGTAYPAEAAVSSWVRSFQFAPAKQELQVQEKYSLIKAISPQQIHYITAIKPGLDGGDVYIDYDEGKRVLIQSNSKNLVPTIEEQMLTDVRHQKVWGEKIYRIHFTEKKMNREATYNFKIKQVEREVGK